MTAPTLRAWLRRLREEDVLAVVTRRVDPRFEMAAVTRRLDGRKAVWYARAGDLGVPVVAGVACTRPMLAGACGTDEAGLVDRLLEAVWYRLRTIFCFARPSQHTPAFAVPFNGGYQ